VQEVANPGGDEAINPEVEEANFGGVE